jgi:hypothetical protein
MVKATLAAAALSSTSNVLAQFFEAYRASQPLAFDVVQFLRFVILGLLTAPPNYKWQVYLERVFPAYEYRAPLPDPEKNKEEIKPERAADSKPRLNLRNTFAKWFIDCITIGAILNTVAFYILMGVLKGQSTAQIGHNVRHETIPLIVTGYKLWPVVSIISFSCVPVEKRIIFLNFIGLLWGVYMSLVASRV